MASIIKRRRKYSVVYRIQDENGTTHQKWETFDTHAEAKRRKAEVEHQQDQGTFIPPSTNTISSLLDEYVSLYGVNNWAPSTYESHKGLIDNYIRPLIGDVKLDDVNPKMMDQFYRQLQAVKAKPRPYGKQPDGCLSAHTIREIHKILRSAFNQAVRWELMARNPVLNANLPKYEPAARDMWDAETLFKAISLCEDDLLRLALHLAFACSLRMGEMLGLTWDCVDISPESIRDKRASIFVNKELQRVSREALEQIDGPGVLFKFPPILACGHTALVLKSPKTRTSVRKIFLPTDVAEMLVERKKEIDELKDLFGDEYTDYNLVFASSYGTPVEGAVINRAFSKLIQENDLPRVVFHSIRHTSTTYKLKLSGGDIKAVQGDTGHAQATMVTEQYAHILDDDRRLNAERFQAEFYSGRSKTAEMPEPAPVQTADTAAPINQAELLKMLTESPEMLAVLKMLTKTM